MPYRFRLCTTEVFQHLLLTTLQLEQYRCRHEPVLCFVVSLASRHQDALKVFDSVPGRLELLIILDHDTITSTMPFRLKSLPVW
jgi:hypothetical protein